MATGDDRSVRAGDKIVGSAVITGDHSTMVMRDVSVQLDSGTDVDVGAELSALRELLQGLSAPDAGKLARALEDAEEEAAKADLDKEEIGAAIERAIKYASKASDFAAHASKIASHLGPLVSWLGSGWTRILSSAGIAF